MQDVKETEKKEVEQAGGITWTCRKMKRALDQEKPACPDPSIYCKYRQGCLVYHRDLLDD